MYLKEGLDKRNDTITYWKENSTVYPTLYSIVRNVLSVASSSVKIEKTFSGVQLFLTNPELALNRMEQCLLLREWATVSRIDIVENSIINDYLNISKIE
ncbi:hypothetical protein DICPUDRAFT_152371 [Dictyostelium purpureum]|uniref:HAT C-terminal dimerisation domain-containing protein n=1 Tax=Dictyostelium purpureum TaxID=5786 RepID=F0ZL66_DICPU|nr:uncharacterized protein DICPUDRAFT_152371 [Dictyostelium purpureum]EGC35293.1 hypothetical protein DICPUDRAFT_152371 [Dictyostelium purpureum]|eukprot:XP_003288160.1 hypothetical protein DICPUDRAFT_152371 [Dictyostelium purpureum]